MGTESTERTTPERVKAPRIEPYLFLVVEGGRLSAGGMRIALTGLESLRVGRGDARVLTRGAGPSLTVPDSRMS